MGFLDKLFGGNGSEVLDKIKDLAETAAKEVSEAAKSVSESVQAQSGEGSNAGYTAQESSGDAPFGISWGEQMPQEENQYNSGKPYDQYFYDIFVEAFPTYRITSEKVRKGSATVITFYNGEIKELVVELLSENSSAMMIRHNCKKEGVPYLRFYYNHSGWWNTKKYVLNRARNALGMSVQE